MKMKSIFKRTVSLLLIGIMVLSSAGCAGTSAPEASNVVQEQEAEAENIAQPDNTASGETQKIGLEGKKVAFVLIGTTFDFFVYMGAKAKEVAQAEGITLDIMSTNDAIEYANLFSQAVTQKYDAIIAVGSKGFVPCYEEAAAAGIPVVIYDSFIDVPTVYGRVGSDNKELGKLAGNYAIDYLKEKNGDFIGKVIVLTNPAGESMLLRAEGFTEALSIHSGIEVEEVIITQLTMDATQKKVDDLLIANGSGTVDIIFGCNAGMTLGAYAAAEVAARSDLAIVGIDNEEGQLAALKSGSIFKATVAQNPIKIGEDVMHVAIKAVKGEKSGDNRVAGTLLTQENVEEYLTKQKADYKALEAFKP